MRQAALVMVAGALAMAPTHGAEAQAGCRGQTLTELNDCVVARTPQVQTEPQSQRVSPRTSQRQLGGALEPTDQRTSARTTATRAGPEPGGVLADRTTEITSPELYGLTRDVRSQYYEVDGSIVRVDRTTRQILNVTPLDDTDAIEVPTP